MQRAAWRQLRSFAAVAFQQQGSSLPEMAEASNRTPVQRDIRLARQPAVN